MNWDDLIPEIENEALTEAQKTQKHYSSLMSSTDTYIMSHRNKYKKDWYENIDHQGEHCPEDKDVDWAWQSYPSYLNSTNSDSIGDIDGNRVREFNKWTLPPEWAFDDDNEFDTSKLLTGSMKKWYDSRKKLDRNKQFLANNNKDYNI